MSRRVRVAVIAGGRSSEHAISVESARSVIDALDPTRYETSVIEIGRNGRWELASGARSLPSSDPMVLTPSTTETLPVVADRPPARVLGEVDVVLPILHGPFGEDGTVQGLLELAGVPYVGSGVLASALCMDKVKAKEILSVHGLPQVPYVALRDTRLDRAHDAVTAAGLAFPVFVKPANMGSSVGVTKVHDAGELAGAVALAAEYDEWVVVEEGIDAREIEVAVLGNAEPRTSLPGEVVSSHEFYDYDDKYVDGTCKLLVPAPLDDPASAQVRDLALRAYGALRCEGLARVDFFLEEGGRGFLVNEVNTIPGFTPVSMYPMLWEASGLAYPDLIDELVRLAVERCERRARFSTKR